MKKIRSLTIQERSTSKYTTKPYIMLQGKWLDKIGFCAKDKVLVTISGDTLIITKVIKEWFYED